MKSNARAAMPQTSNTHSDSVPMGTLKRIKPAFLEEYTRERQGYDPYDTSTGRSPDVWRAKRKRA